MKKLILFSVIASNLLIGAEGKDDGANLEFGINGGMTSIINEGTNKYNNPTVGLTVQSNDYKVKPRVDFNYVKIDNEDPADGGDETVTLSLIHI